MKWLIVGFFYVISGNLLFSQNANDLLERLQKEREIVLLKNENSIIPFKRLDSVSYAILKIGDYSFTDFEQRCESYLMPKKISNVSNDLFRLNLPLKDINTLIVLHVNSNLDSLAIQYLNSIANTHRLIHVSFQGNDFIANNNWLGNGDGLIQAYDFTTISQDYVAQLIFGGIGATGKLSENINEIYQSGAGNTTVANRLKYTIPEEVGVISDTLYNRVNKIIEIGLEQQAFPGVQVMAVKDGKVFYHEAFGYHTYDSLRPLRKNDIYDLASVTKVTASTLALMKLHDEGTFDLDVPAYQYWQDFRRGDKKELTFRSILAHNARLKSWIPYWTTTKRKNGKYKKRTLSVQSGDDYSYQLSDSLYMHRDYKRNIYKMIRKSPLNESRGYVYSGLSFYLYPQIVENLSGQNFSDFLQNEYYLRLGAETIDFNAGDRFPLERIVPTEIDTFFRMKPLHGEVHDEGAAMMEGVSGNAGLFGTAGDLAKVWQMLLNGGIYGGEQYLSPQTIDKFTACQYCEEGNRRGLGFDKPLIVYDSLKSSVSKLASYKSFGHSGYTGTFVWADPENDFLFIFLSNRVYPTRNNRKIYQLNIRPDLHDVFNRLLK